VQHGTFELDVPCTTITLNSSVSLFGRGLTAVSIHYYFLWCDKSWKMMNVAQR